MGFWFYDTKLLDNYSGKTVNDFIKKTTVSWLVAENTEVLPQNIEAILDEIRCLQVFLLNKRPTIIDLALYTGEPNVIVLHNRAFYYVDKIDNMLIIRGIAYNMFVRYDMDLVSGACDIKHYLLSVTSGSSSLIDQDIKQIMSKFVAKETVTLSDMNIFNGG